MALEVSGWKIRELRERKRLDQHSLAELLRRRGLGTTQATVSRWEHGQSPRAHALPHIAATLGVDVADLYAEAAAGVDEEADDLSDLFTALRKYIDGSVARRVNVGG